MNIPELPKYKFFQVEEDRRIAYLEYGEHNKNTIICIHGLTRNSSDYHLLALKLAKHHYRIIVPDIAGRGESDSLKNTKDYNYHFYRDDILKLVDSLKIEKCYWIGTSMGGIMSFLVNEIRPNFIEKLILNDIGPQIPIKTTRQIHRHFLSLPDKFDSLEEIEKKTKITFTFFGISKKDDWEFFIKHSIKKNDDSTYSFRYDSGIFNSLNDEYALNYYLRGDGSWDLWDKMKMPTLLIWGNLSTMLTIDTIKKMQENKDNFYKITIYNVGHTPHFMNNELNTIIAHWLDTGVLTKNEIKDFII